MRKQRFQQKTLSTDNQSSSVQIQHTECSQFFYNNNKHAEETHGEKSILNRFKDVNKMLYSKPN